MRTILALGLLLVLPAGAEAQARMMPTQGPDTVARAALQTFARLVNTRNFRSFGFQNAEEVRTATLGEPLREAMVQLDALRGYRQGGNPDALLQPVGRLTYPVLVRGAVRSSLTLTQVEGGWKPASFGDPALIRSIEELRTPLATAAQVRPAEFTLVRVPALNVVFLARSVDQRLLLYPLADDSRFDFRRGGAVPAADAFARLGPAAREHNGEPT